MLQEVLDAPQREQKFSKLLTTRVLPGHQEFRQISDIVGSGIRPFLEVGEKLAGRISGSEGVVLPRRITLYQAADALPEPVWSDLSQLGRTMLTWTHISQLLSNPSDEMRAALPSRKTQLAIRSSTGSCPELILRVQVNWEIGHSIGLRKDIPDWVWLNGTVFPVYES